MNNPVSLDKSNSVSLDKVDSTDSTIIVGFLTGEQQSVSVEKGSSSTVAALLEKAGIDAQKHADCEVMIDGETGTLETLVTEGKDQEVLLVEPLNGN